MKKLLDFVSLHTAGSPTDTQVYWTSLRPCDIAQHLKEVHKLEISHLCIKRILKSNGYVKRKPIKCLATGSSPIRKEQFEILNFLVALFHEMEHNPIISIDTKKKEHLGQLTRNEAVIAKKGKIPMVYSADYSFLATGKAIPQGIFDVKLNKGYLSIGNSNETAEFIIDNLKWWWQEYGQYQYANATHILILADCGGANGYRHHLFKVLLQKLARQIGIRIVVCHYPPYCSKYNPIERKFFSHVHRTIKNTILTSLKQTRDLMAKATHKKGLTTVARTVEKFYPLKQPSNKEDIDEHRILRHPELPLFSYTILP